MISWMFVCFELTGRIVNQGINSHKFLEEHDANTDMSSAPAATLGDICPRGQLQQDGVFGASTLQIRMLFSIHFLVETDLDQDVHVLLAHASVRGWQATWFGQALECFLVAAL